MHNGYATSSIRQAPETTQKRHGKICLTRKSSLQVRRAGAAPEGWNMAFVEEIIFLDLGMG